MCVILCFCIVFSAYIWQNKDIYINPDTQAENSATNCPFMRTENNIYGYIKCFS